MRQYQLLKLVMLILIGVILFPVGYSDEITLTNGTRIICVVIAKDDKALIAETEFGTITLRHNVIADIRTDNAETNFILRGDFARSRGQINNALQFYGEAMILNPKSELAQNRYNELRHFQDELYRQELLALGRQADEDPKVTTEIVEGAQAKKELGEQKTVSLQAEGTGLFPLFVRRGENRDRIALQHAKINALEKIFPNGLGIGFRSSGTRVTLLPEGEIPNCEVEIINREKTATGYNVTVRVTGPVESIFVNIPEDAPVIESIGHTKNIRGRHQREVRQRAILDAMEQAIIQAINEKNQNQPDRNNRFTGRIFLVNILEEALTPSGYVTRINTRIWFNPV